MSTRDTRFRACPLCEAICGLELRYEDDTLVAIRGDAADPFSRGHICPKGNAILDLEADPDRVRRPLRRTSDGWQEMPWDEALAWAGERLAAVQGAHGSAALGAYLGNPNVHHFGHSAYLPFLLRALRTPNVYSASSVDQWPHQLVCSLMYGHQFLIPIPDLDHCDFLLMLGANPAASMGSLMTAPDVVKRLKALTARGQLVVIDPRRTETAALASAHHAIRPGTDALFLVALFNLVLVRAGTARLGHLAAHVRGLDQVCAALAGFDVPRIAEVCGIAVDSIVAIADALLAAPRAAVYGRMGLSTQAFGSLCQWLIQLLNLLTGNLDRVGGVLTNEAAIPLTGPGTSPGKRGRWHSRVRGLPEFAGELPVAALTEEITTPGAGQIRALLTVAGNPVLSTPNGRALDAALGGLEFMVSVDIYRNETTRHADLILPPASPLTQPHYDLVFNGLAIRRVARYNAPTQSQPADQRADWQILDGLGAAWAAASGQRWSPLPPPDTLIAASLARGNSGLTLDALKAAPHGIDLGPLQPNLLARLETPDRKIDAAPELLLADLPRLRVRLEAVAEPSGLQLIGRRDIRSNNSWMHNAPRLVKGRARHQLLMHPDDLAARGLADGAQVRIRSASGNVLTEVCASSDMAPGVVCLPHGFGHQREGVALQRATALAGASYNDLGSVHDLDAPSGNAALNGLGVEVEAA